jgi:hypothetical protein
MANKQSTTEKLVKLFENVNKTKMEAFKKYLNENPQLEPITQPAQPEPQVLPMPAPATPATKPATRPNPFAPSIEPDADPKAMAAEGEEAGNSNIDVLANKLSDMIAATYNKAKGQAPQQRN